MTALVQMTAFPPVLLTYSQIILPADIFQGNLHHFLGAWRWRAWPLTLVSRFLLNSYKSPVFFCVALFLHLYFFSFLAGVQYIIQAALS